MGNSNYHSNRDIWRKLKVSFPGNVDYRSILFTTVKVVEHGKNMSSIFDIQYYFLKQKETIKKEKRIQRRKHADSIQKKVEINKPVIPKKKHSKVNNVVPIKSKHVDVSKYKEYIEKERNQKEEEIRDTDLEEPHKKTNILLRILTLLFFFMIIASFPIYKYVQSLNALSVSLKPNDHTYSENVDHVIDIFLYQRKKMQYGSLFIQTDIKFSNIKLYGDFGNKIYTPYIKLPVGLYKIEAIGLKNIIANEYISSGEDKTIAILANNKNRSISDLTRLIKTYPYAVNLYTEKAIKLARNKSFLKALQFLDYSIKKFPSSAELYSEKARLLTTNKIFLKRGRNNKNEALVAAWHSIELNPSVRMLDGLSSVLAANKQYDLAIKLQNTIINNQDKYYTIYGRNNKKFKKTIDEKINAYSRKMLWTPEGIITSNSLEKGRNLLEDAESKYDGTSGFTNFLNKANDLKGKYPTKKYCTLYGKIAILQNKRNKKQNCNLEAKNDLVHPLWHDDTARHSTFCNDISVYASRKFTQDREIALESCINSQ